MKFKRGFERPKPFSITSGAPVAVASGVPILAPATISLVLQESPLRHIVKGVVGMKLNQGNFHVKDLKFGEKTELKGGILTINKEEALGVVKEDFHITEADLFIVGL